MLVFQTLDVFDEKQKIKAGSKAPGGAVEPTYLGLLLETFVSHYEFDIYGYISNTNYKYVIVKNEQKTAQNGAKPHDDNLKTVSFNNARCLNESSELIQTCS